MKNMSPYELGETGSKDAIPYLAEYLKSSKPNEVRLSASAIRKLSAKYRDECNLLVPHLLTAITSSKAQVTQYIFKTLVELDTAYPLDLIQKIASTDEKSYNQDIARRILINIDNNVKGFQTQTKMAGIIKKTIIVFANSVKKHQHCVAGKDIGNFSWVRPVSNAEGDELSNSQCLYENPHGKYLVKTLQKIEITFKSHDPLIHQPENFTITDDIWLQKFKIEPEEIEFFLDTPDSLWGDGNRIDYYLIESKQVRIEQSLYLVRVDDLKLIINSYNKRRAIFTYLGNDYDLPVTDPNFDKYIQNPQFQSILCVSLGEKYDPTGGNHYSCYKIVASIF